MDGEMPLLGGASCFSSELEVSGHLHGTESELGRKGFASVRRLSPVGASSAE